jgi:hypothetical protein
MDLTNEAAVGGSEATSIAVAPAPAGETPLGAREAARNLASWRQSRDKQPSRPQASGEGGDRDDPLLAPAQEATNATAAGEREAPVDEPARAERDNEPVPIEPPSTWSKQDKELFASLPRALQERLAERERSREDVTAEQRKVLEADHALLDQARQQYEATLPQLLALLQQQHAAEFADIKTPADIERVANDDRARYVKWDLQRKRIAELAQEALGAQGRRQAEQRRRFVEFARRQDDLFKDKVPEMADPAEFA